MPKSTSSFYTSNMSLASERGLEMAKDFVKGSLKALNIGGSTEHRITPECEQPILKSSGSELSVNGEVSQMVHTATSRLNGSNGFPCPAALVLEQSYSSLNQFYLTLISNVKINNSHAPGKLKPAADFQGTLKDKDSKKTISGVICSEFLVTYPEIPGSIPDNSSFSLKQWVWNGVNSASLRLMQSYLNEKVAAQIIREFCNTTVEATYGISMSSSQLNILWSTLVSIFLVGGVTGSLTGGWVADKFGSSSLDILEAGTSAPEPEEDTADRGGWDVGVTASTPRESYLLIQVVIKFASPSDLLI
uniref:Major facilitator superfamily (MFS) profile domain-containing protein n=1 Tax=Timema douglasi TaxID=61478 RepID=A0A7R8Z9G3_TIMDO|nr:unnamed protein product [Timema douglasi]